jgi:hypothetical protein
MIGTNRRFLAVVTAVVAVSAVLATGVAVTSTSPIAAAKTATNVTLSASKTDIHIGDTVTIGGKLVTKASRDGIPNQVIHVDALATASNQTLVAQRNTTTDASGNFGGAATVRLSGLPSSITQATVQMMAIYDGNAQYAPCRSQSIKITVHF